MQQVRVAVVTGGGSGIGAAAALALAADGWQVVLAGRRAGPAGRGGCGRRRRARRAAGPVPTDVTDEAAVVGVFDGAVAEYGRVDLLFNNAGMFAPSRDLDEIPLAEWNAVVAVNLTGAFLCAREAFRVMRAQDPQGGRIINNGSISAHAPRVAGRGLHRHQTRDHRSDQVDRRSTAGRTTSPAGRSTSATRPPS